MVAQQQREEVLAICNKCQSPVSDPQVGKDGEKYHRKCGRSLAMFE